MCPIKYGKFWFLRMWQSMVCFDLGVSVALSGLHHINTTITTGALSTLYAVQLSVCTVHRTIHSRSTYNVTHNVHTFFLHSEACNTW